MFMEGTRQVGVSFICVECICQEESTLEEESTRLAGSIWSEAFLFLICGLLRGQSNGSFECKGSTNNKGKEQGCIASSSKQERKGAHSSRGAYPKEPIAKLERSLQSIRFLCIYLPFCISCFKHTIYMHSSQTDFPQGGFIEGHVDQKYLCSFSCVSEFRTAVFFSCKDLEECYMF